MTAGMLVGCGGAKTEAPAETPAATEETAEASTEEASGEQEVLEFYHGYFHDEATWYPAVVMREIYQEFADMHADGPVKFEPIALDGGSEQVLQIATNEVAGGSFPDMVDFAGYQIPLAAVSQELVYDMKGYIDAEGLESKVGLNYTANQIDGKIYTVHDQLTTLGFWYNADAYAAAGVDITAGYKAVELMKEHIAKTKTAGVCSGVGGFGGLFELDLTGMTNPILVSGTDGVGTKLKIAFLICLF